MKMRQLLFSLTLFISATLSAQTPLSEAPRRADLSPAWPGCDQRMTDCTKSRLAEFISSNVQLPPAAREAGKGGVVMVDFVVEKTGLVGEVKAAFDPGNGLAEEATRVITMLKDKKIKFTPAEQDGKRIAYRYTVPISFNMDPPPRIETSVKNEPDPVVLAYYETVEMMPRFAGCDSPAEDSTNCTFIKIVNFLKTNLKYPEEGLEKKTEGRVVVEFIVDPAGAVTNPKVAESLGEPFDAEALRVIGTMPAWTPGYQDGKAVPVKMTVPINFMAPRE